MSDVKTARATHGTLTAEQVPEAARGHYKLYMVRDEEYEVKMDALLCRLTNGKWSKSRAHDLDFMEACIREEFEALYSEGQSPAPVGGMLKAEQVRKAVEGHGNIMDNRLYEDWQAAAEELNAELGGGTCKITATATNNLMYPDYMVKWYELSCGHSLTLNGDEAPKWCAVCGKAVER